MERSACTKVDMGPSKTRSAARKISDLNGLLNLIGKSLVSILGANFQILKSLN
jgi:hypothetical protein